MKKHLIFSLILSLTFNTGIFNTSVFAQATSNITNQNIECEVLKFLNEELEKDRINLFNLTSLYQEQLRVQELERHLVQGDEMRDILILADTLDEEAGVRDSQKTQLATGIMVSTGALILASFVIKKINQETAGMGLKALLKSQFSLRVPWGQDVPFFDKTRFLKHGINAAVLFSVVATVVNSYRLIRTFNDASQLRDVLEKLSKLRNLSPQIMRLQEKIGSDQIEIDLRVADLISRQKLKIQNGEFICL